MTYEEFLKAKVAIEKPRGVDVGPDEIGPYLFDFQSALTMWALRLGRAAIFAGTGLGKTAMELAWCDALAKKRNVQPLIVAPLAVAKQIVGEASKFGVSANYCSTHDDVREGSISITNYQRLHLFNCSEFGAVALDESSIIKAADGKTRNQLMTLFRDAPYILAATATPAPNDFMELGNHAELLGVCTLPEMLSTFFVHDGGETQKWRLKGHAVSEFWKWMCSWSVMIQNPSDLGFDGSAYELPPLTKIHHRVASSHDVRSASTLFPMPAETLSERLGARRESIEARCKKAAEIVLAEPGEQWLIWCNLNPEGDLLEKLIPGAVQVAGSDTDEHKENALIGFADGSVRVLVTKPKIAGFGMNFQSCARQVFVGLNDSWEQIYQAIRRSWRFGQLREVQVHFVSADTEGNVVANLDRKENQATEMMQGMVDNMAPISTEAIRENSTIDVAYTPDREMEIPSWL